MVILNRRFSGRIGKTKEFAKTMIPSNQQQKQKWIGLAPF
jgi:hypothetical protein